MIAGVDSKAPSNASIAAAKARGVGLWAGYHGKIGDYIAADHLWSDADFGRVLDAGLATFAYVSGQDDPLAIKAWSRSTGIKTCLDVEAGIRPDGAWVEGWVLAAESGVYGNGSVHYNAHGYITATFHIFSGYYGYNPKDTWPSWDAHPPTPCGWQWLGSHINYGANIDALWLDNWFGGLHGPHRGTIGGDNLDLNNPQDAALIYRVAYGLGNIPLSAVPAAQQAAVAGIVPLPQIKSELDALKAEVDQLKVSGTTTDLSPLATKLDALAKHLGVGTP